MSTALGTYSPAFVRYCQILQRLHEAIELLEPIAASQFSAHLQILTHQHWTSHVCESPEEEEAIVLSRTKDLEPLLLEVEALAHRRSN